MRTLVTGATGTLGGALLPRLQTNGHTVRAASRSPPSEHETDERRSTSGTPPTDEVEWVELDLVTGEGIEAAMRDVDVVIHAASAPTGDTEAVDVVGTERLLDAATDAGVSNFVYVSIVGIEGIPYSYYDAKVAAEQAIEDADVPHTILRATQFHEFVADILDTISMLPVWPLPTKLQIQPVAVGEVADVLVDHAVPDPQGRMVPMGGPEIHTVGELARRYRDARGLRRPVVRLPIPTGTFSAFQDGKATCPDRAVGMVTWAEWLGGEFGPAGVSEAATTTEPRADTT